MAQYSASDGSHTSWHLGHYWTMLQRGPGLVMVEATAVQANGRASPQDSGIYDESHLEMLRKEVEIAHGQNAKIGIQPGHAGRKASTIARTHRHGLAPMATEEDGGWPDDVMGPSSEPFDAQHANPRAMTIAEIEQLKGDFVMGAKRAIQAGFDVIELHFGHGYLVASFLTPAINKRQDKYGGTFNNRVRLALEIIEGVRAEIPESTPLFVRISATDWLENNPEYQGESWTVEDSAELAVLLATRGVDVLDVSSGGSHSCQKIKDSPGYQAIFAKEIEKRVGDALLVSAVGSITSGTSAEALLVGGHDEDDVPLDLIAAGRGFLKNPGLVWQWADELGVSIHMPPQLGWPFSGRIM
ncbi:hypothetical protein ACHAPT_013275 [Fusarium lateritium]